MEVHVSLVGRKDLTGEIYRQLRRAILDGRLAPGGRLPPTRELAGRLNVSRTTVTVAYDRLTGEGFITSRVGAGTFVSDDVAAPGGPARAARGALRPRALWDAVAVQTVFDKPVRFDFRTGIPDTTLFPYQSWRRLLARQLRPSAVGAGAYGDPAGHAGLRLAIARHVGLARGVQAGAEDVVVTNGTQQAIDLVARVLLAPGDRVAVESPGYGPPRRLLASLGAEVAGVPVDDQGLVVEAIPRDLAAPLPPRPRNHHHRDRRRPRIRQAVAAGPRLTPRSYRYLVMGGPRPRCCSSATCGRDRIRTSVACRRFSLGTPVSVSAKC
jgi:GntR family transcriptional regulator / MocR family aminotransferase